MTKQQKLCVGAGSAFGLCVLALGWFLYSAYAERKEIMSARSKPRILMITNDPSSPKVVINVNIE